MSAPQSIAGNTKLSISEEPQRSSKATSCNECRRLKLKCSKTPWPCDMCVKRRLAHICPDGVQKRERPKHSPSSSGVQGRSSFSSNAVDGSSGWSGDGISNNAVWSRLNSVEQKLDLLLADRGYPSSSRASTSGLHDLANVAFDHSRMERDSQPQSPASRHGLLALHADGRSSYVGPHAHSVYLARDDDVRSSSRPASPSRGDASRPGSPTPVDYESVAAAQRPAEEAPSGTSPLDTLTPSNSDAHASLMAWSTPGFRSPHSSAAIWGHLRPMLPSKDVAKRMVDVYFASVPFMHVFVTREEMDAEIWPMFYGGEELSVDRPPTGFHVHKMSLLFAIFALGVLMDVKRPQRDPVGRALYSCGWNALVLANFTESTSLDALLALVHLALYLTWRRAGRYSESAWPLFGVMTSMMTRAGLHRDPGHFDLKEADRERRRRLFWHLHGVEVLRSLGFCRPPAIRERHVDTRMPHDWIMDTDEERPMSIEAQINAFHAAKCLQTQLINQVLDECLCAPSTYSTTMAYDARIRKLMRSFPAWMTPVVRPLTRRSTKGVEDMDRTYTDEIARQEMLHTMRCHLTFVNLQQLHLLLHRAWFSEALQQSSGDLTDDSKGGKQPSKSGRFQQSVNAVNESASRIIELVISVWSHYPALVLRWMFFWNGLFSAAVCRGLFAVRRRRGTEAHAAWRDLRSAIALLRLAVEGWKPLETPLGILLRLDRRAEIALGGAMSGNGVEARASQKGVQDATQVEYATRAANIQGEDMTLLGDTDFRRERKQSAEKRNATSIDGADVDASLPTSVRGGKRVRMKDDVEIMAQADGPTLTFDRASSTSSIPGVSATGSLVGIGDGQTLDFSLFSPHDLTLPASLPAFMLGGGGSVGGNLHDDLLPFTQVGFNAASSDATLTASAVNDGDFATPLLTDQVIDENANANNNSNASQLIQMLSAGVGWEDVTSWDNAIFDL